MPVTAWQNYVAAHQMDKRPAHSPELSYKHLSFWLLSSQKTAKIQRDIIKTLLMNYNDNIRSQL
ncbi:hypothetical protein AO371_1581 [Moraxella catarrhalis]|nr:hypothetical protein AO378_0867 [Moraxella catarrhalis]OAV14464.1 hypothetical protein AO376_1054 [Moraxella catarrhalis]OAV16251.1 hypothetical protein AO374_1738 [Moraxella catarrhalis]OAV23314.1 hypothetical protein AO371_1581 [Moraxella catarrhalis]